MRSASGRHLSFDEGNAGGCSQRKGSREHCANRRHTVLTHGWQATFERVKGRQDAATLTAAASKLNIHNQNGLPIRFVAQTHGTGQRHYEEQIYRTGCVPTRPDNLHDFYNACAWLTFPKTKAALNALHVEQPPTTIRSRLSDAATVFDESGAVLIGPNPALAGLIIDHNWRDAFVTNRAWWQDHHLILVGHAVLEKLHAPYPGMIVKATYQPWPSDRDISDEPSLRELDHLLASRWLEREFTGPSDLFPIPVLGLPGADPDNEHPEYYNNRSVFR